MPIGPQDVVPAPPLSPPAQGLLIAADVIDHGDGDERGLNGIRFSPEHCGDLEVWAASCGTQGTQKGTGRNRPAEVANEPFAVIARDECSTFGFRAADYEARARRALDAKMPKAVEAEFWNGTLIPGNRNLVEPTATVVGTGLGLRLALATLSQAIAVGNGGIGMIHARPLVVMQWFSLGLLRWDQGKLRTAMGNLVVAGYGYSGIGPAGQVPANGTEWAYATEAVQVERWPVVTSPDDPNEQARIAQATDRTNNAVAFRAERMAAVKWGGCVHAAVEVNVTIV